MNEATRRYVRERAEHRCEYCGLLQSLGALVRFHVEHIVPRQHGGGCPLRRSTRAVRSDRYLPSARAAESFDRISSTRSFTTTACSCRFFCVEAASESIAASD